MIVLSKNILCFIQRLQEMAQSILICEVKADVGSKQCQLYVGDYRLQFSIRIFEGKSSLGYFDSSFLEIGINQTLLYTAKTEVLRNILRHEIAHMMLYLNQQYGGADTAVEETDHGTEFRKFCLDRGWGEDVFRASGSVEKMNENIPGNSDAKRMIEKVKKLLRLADSSNPHEAELATIKANQILLDYNLSISSTMEDDTNRFYINRVLSVKRSNAKFQAISRIIATFYVFPVSHPGTGVTHLEVTGIRANVEIAAYVAQFLDSKLDALWLETRKQHPHLKGLAAKNSFLRGLAQGYVDKINRVKKDLPAYKFNAITIVEQNLDKIKIMAYPKLRTTYSSTKNHKESKALGELAGNKLTIQEPISGNTEKQLRIGR